MVEKIKSNKTFYILVLLVLLAAVLVFRSGGDCDESCIAESDIQFRIFEDISTSEAYGMIQSNADNPDFVILDVRTPEEFEAGHIKGAVNLDFNSESFRDQLDDLDKAKVYLAYCRTARRSGLAFDIMREVGFIEVYNMSGGIVQWEADGLPIVEPALTGGDNGKS